MLLFNFSFGNRIVCTAANHNEGEFVWYNGKQAITYSVSKSVSPVVTIALDMFTGDMKQVTGVLPQKLIQEIQLLKLYNWTK